MSLGNGRLPPDTFRLVGPNISKHLTARIHSETEVQKNIINFRNVLKSEVQEPGADRQPTSLFGHSSKVQQGDVDSWL
jgi:hypothetical protein